MIPQVIDTLVIGAGPAGLTTAYKLAQREHDVTVLEADPVYVGGISRTETYKGYHFDIGGHRFYSKSQEIVDLWNEILPDDFVERPRLSRIFYNGKFYSYPLNAIEAFRNLGLMETTACVASFIWARMRPIPEPRTFHEWVRNNFGERLFSIFFKTYTEKVWGMSCDEISADWAAQRIKGLDLRAAIADAVRRTLGLGGKGGQAKTLIQSFRYPRRGPGMMWEAAARKIRGYGGRIEMDRRVTGLSWNEGSRIWTVEATSASGEKHVYSARNVVSSAPLRDLVKGLKPTALSYFHAGQLRYRDFLTVILIGKSAKPFDDNWVYIHDPSVMVGRVQNLRSWSPEMLPDPHSTCLELEYFCFEGDGLWTATNDELIARAKEEIARIGLMRAEDVTDATVVRQEKAYPIYDDTYADNVEVVRRELESRFPTLHLVGRNGMHKYNNQDHAMMTGILTAENIIAGSRCFDVWGVNEDAEYGEAGGSAGRDALESLRLTPRRVA